jgi:fatty-acyl-CoA synthase
VILQGPPLAPPAHPTLRDAFDAAADARSGVTFVSLREEERFLRWGEVRERALRAAAALAALGVAPGDRVAIVVRTEPAFLDAFFGAWYAGAVPVPLYPPVRLGRMDEYVASTARMLVVSGARLVVAAGAVRRLLGEAIARARPALGCVDAAELERPRRGLARAVGPDDLGLVQFSSGSTVDPKPVALTHRALAAQIAALFEATGRPDAAREALVSWLPLYHDMGLLGGLLAPATYPGRCVLLPPEHFLARPALWLRAIARHGGTLSPAPSFAYAYCADRIRDDDLRGLSLASWRLALDGAEAVSADAMRRFAERFAPHGFDPASLVPVYGLSEAALAVTFARRGRPLAGLRVDPIVLARDGLAAPSSPRPPHPAHVGGEGERLFREVVSVGAPVPGVSVAVRDEGGRALPEGRVGRLHVRSASLFREYLGDPAATARALRDGWLDTGDLGFVHAGELHVTGRAKDVVVVRGANHAPEEFEAALAGVAGLRPGCAVALGFPSDGGGEGLLVLAERGRGGEGDPLLAERARRAILEHTGIAPDAVQILAPGTLPRTSSGKLRRTEALRRHLAGALRPPRRANAITVALALARSALASARSAPRGPGGPR